MKKSFLLLAGVMVGGLALADNVTDKFPWIHEGYIYLTTKDSGSSSFGGSLKNWSDGKVPQPGHDYYSAKNGLRTPKGADEAYTFGGDSITINAERRTDNPAVTHASGKALNWGDAFHVVQGSYVYWALSTIRGTLYVHSKADNPFMFYYSMNSANGTAEQEWTLTGDADAVLDYRVDNGRQSGSFKLSGDFSDYKGVLDCRNDAAEPKVDLGVEFCAPSMPDGTIRVGARSRLQVTGTAGTDTQIGTIELEGGTKLALSAKSDLLVSHLKLAAETIVECQWDSDNKVGRTVRAQTLTLPETGTITLKGNFYSNGATATEHHREVLLAVAKGEDDELLDLSRFVLELPGQVASETTGYLPVPKLELVTTETEQQLVATYDVVNQRTTKKGNVNDANWTDGQVPQVDRDYFIQYVSSLDTIPGTDLKGPIQTYTGSGDITFVGRSLTLGFTLYVSDDCTSFAAKSLVGVKSRNWSALSGIQTGIQETFTLKADEFVVYPVSADETGEYAFPGLQSPGGQKVMIETPLKGSGTFQLQHHREKAQLVDWYLTKPSPEFTGSLHVLTHQNLGVSSNTKSHYGVLHVDDPLALGGAPSSFRFDALELRDWAGLEVTNDLTLATANRGLYVLGTARITPKKDCRLEVREPLTMSGQLRKSGDGVLALGGTEAPRFTKKRLETPSAGTNLVCVLAGSLVALSTNALDGLQISFGGTGAIAAPLATDDAALARYGFVNLKAATPFEVAEGAHVPVTVDGAAAPAGGATVAVCTIAKAAADALTFKGVSPWKRYRVRPYVVDNGDGTATVKADVEPAGLAIIFK